jgi:signal peptidase I
MPPRRTTRPYGELETPRRPSIATEDHAPAVLTTSTADGDAASAQARHRRGGLAFLKELVFVIVGAIIVSALLRAFVGQMFIIPSDSMQNTLLEGDRVVVQKLTAFHRGDIVVFKDPAHWLPEPEPARPVDRLLGFIGVPTASSPGHLIKRAIGLPGDTVVCCDDQGRVTVNGTALDETPYLYTSPGGEQVAPSLVKFSVVVPRDHIFVMGDHRDDSADSRCHLSDPSVEGRGQTAFVPESDVVGPAFALVSPFSRATRFRAPPTFAAVPAPTRPAPGRATIDPAGISC